MARELNPVPGIEAPFTGDQMVVDPCLPRPSSTNFPPIVMVRCMSTHTMPCLAYCCVYMAGQRGRCRGLRIPTDGMPFRHFCCPLHSPLTFIPPHRQEESSREISPCTL